MKKMIFVFLIAVLIAVAGILFYAPGEFETKQIEGKNQKMISIENSKFVPDTVSVQKGTEVIWINNDNMLHDVTLDNGAFDKDLQPGESFSFIFSEAGEYSYHCDIHAAMIGKIIVG